LPLLREHLDSGDYILFSAAVQAAQEMTCAGVTQVLTAGLDGLPADNQILVIQTLGKRGDPAALPALFKVAKSGPVPVRVAAVRAMPDIGDAAAVPMLAELIGAGSQEVAQAAQEALGALPGREADDAVMAMFTGNDQNGRTTALALMGRRRMTSSIPTLLKTARDGDAALRPAVIKMVGELGDAAQLPALLDLLMKVNETQDISAAEQAIDTVCKKTENPQTQVGRLIELLDRAPVAQKMSLLRVLGGIGGPEALKAVRGAVDSSEADVRTVAIRTLSTWKTPDAAPHLLALAKNANNRNERTLFLRGYLGMAGRRNLPVAQRLEMCRQAAEMIQRDDERKLLLGTLGNIESPATLALIVPHLDNAGTREEAGMAVVAVAEKILKSKYAAKNASKLVAPLEKVTQAAVSDNLNRRAKGLLQQAKDKAGDG
jgi:HEAT repeat protein